MLAFLVTRRLMALALHLLRIPIRGAIVFLEWFIRWLEAR
jgi:hypothetical protein